MFPSHSSYIKKPCTIRVKQFNVQVHKYSFVSDLKFLQTLPDFMLVVIPPLYRAPEFAPEPPVFDNEMDAITSEETPFEVWTYLMAFR